MGGGSADGGGGSAVNPFAAAPVGKAAAPPANPFASVNLTAPAAPAVNPFASVNLTAPDKSAPSTANPFVTANLTAPDKSAPSTANPFIGKSEASRANSSSNGSSASNGASSNGVDMGTSSGHSHERRKQLNAAFLSWVMRQMEAQSVALWTEGLKVGDSEYLFCSV